MSRLLSFLGPDDDLVSTSTIASIYPLKKGDEIFVTVQKEKNHGESKLVSNSQSSGIQFIGQRISD